MTQKTKKKYKSFNYYTQLTHMRSSDHVMSSDIMNHRNK